MLVAIVDIAHNCPVHNGHDFYGLQWFTDEHEIIEWVRANTKQNIFIREIWDDGKKERTNLLVKYEMSQHHVNEAHIKKGGKIIALVRRHPYSDEKDWIVEERLEE